MPDQVEREIKVPYDSPAVARPRVVEAGATPLRARRLQNDCLLDARRNRLATASARCVSGSTTTARTSPSRARPALGRTKVREELETRWVTASCCCGCSSSWFRVWFRYQKYREEFRRGDLVIAVDESPSARSSKLEGSRRTSSPWRRGSSAPPPTSCSTPIWLSSANMVQPRDRQRAICCSTNRDRHAAARARARRRAGHPAAPADVLPGESGGAGRRRPGDLPTADPAGRPWGARRRGESASPAGHDHGVVGDGAALGCRVRYSWERVLLGSAGGPRRALPLLDDRFFLINGDTLCDVDLRDLLDAHLARNARVTLAVTPNPAPRRYGGVLADADGWVRGFARAGDPRNPGALRRSPDRRRLGVRGR